MENCYPTVTIVIPMRNEEHRIGRCLDSILANDFPREQLEILVADGMSTDHSRAIVADRTRHFPGIVMLDNPKQIVSSGLNIGIFRAHGRVIIIMGAHSEYPSNYIGTCVRELARTQADVVGGMLDTQPGADTLIAHAIALMTQHPFGVGRSAFRTRCADKDVDTVPYGAYRREVFERVGLFNEQLIRNQDFEFSARVRKAGGRLFLSPDLKVVYYNVPDLRRLSAQAFNNGFWLAKMWYASRVSFRFRHAIPLAFVSVLLLSIVLSAFSAWAMAIAAATLSSYALAAAVASGQIAFREHWRFFLPLIGLLFIHHFLYGLGTLTGLLSALQPKLAHRETTLPNTGCGLTDNSPQNRVQAAKDLVA